jgi:hypothetical protein
MMDPGDGAAGWLPAKSTTAVLDAMMTLVTKRFVCLLSASL